MADTVKEARDEYQSTQEQLDQVLMDLRLLRVQHIGILAGIMLLGLGVYQLSRMVTE